MPITGIFDRTLGRVVSMQEAWERAVAAALGGGSPSPPRSLTLDGAVKCIYGQLHPFDRVLDRFQSLEHLSIANIGVSSLEKFPRLRNLQRLILSDNRISGGLEFLVGAGLESLRDLDLSNNRIQSLEDLAPLARLRLVSLDLYECPVTRIADYRARVFALISSLKYLDKLDSDGNERPESDDDDDDDDEEDDEEEEEDPGSGEVDGEEKVTNGVVVNGVIDADEDDESDADEEETVRPTANGSHHVANGFRVAPVGDDEDDVDDEDFDEDDVDDEDGDDDGDQGEEIDEDDVEDEDVVEVHDISDSDDGDGVEAEEDLEEEEDDDDDEVDGDGDEDEEDVEDEEGDGEPGSSVRMMSTDGEIDGHEQGEGEGEEDDNGEIGEEDEGVEEDEVDLEEEEEDDLGDDYHVQPHVVRAPAGEFEACNGEDEDGVEDDDNEAHHVHSNGASTSSHPCNGEDEDVVEDDNGDFPQHVEDPSSSSLASKRKRDAVSDDDVEDLRSSKQR